jgi:hypothetical protein
MGDTATGAGTDYTKAKNMAEGLSGTNINVVYGENFPSFKSFEEADNYGKLISGYGWSSDSGFS